MGYKPLNLLDDVAVVVIWLVAVAVLAYYPIEKEWAVDSIPWRPFPICG